MRAILLACLSSSLLVLVLNTAIENSDATGNASNKKLKQHRVSLLTSMDAHQQNERSHDFPSSGPGRQRLAVQEIADNLADAAQLLRERFGGVSHEQARTRPAVSRNPEPVTANLSLLGRIESVQSGRQSTAQSNVASNIPMASASRQSVKRLFPPPSMFARKRPKTRSSI